MELGGNGSKERSDAAAQVRNNEGGGGYVRASLCLSLLALGQQRVEAVGARAASKRSRQERCIGNQAEPKGTPLKAQRHRWTVRALVGVP